MSSFIRNGNNYMVHPDDAMDIRPKLPPGTYSVMADPDRGFFLQTNPNLSVDHKVYGSSERMSDRILNTYSVRPQNTGVLLSGAKGTGKTVLGKLTAMKAVEKGMVTLMVNHPFTGESFNKFISNVSQECLVFFDEFEKVYRRPEDQALMLTLFDGLYKSKKLFVVTINQSDKISEFMLNRPGRFFYHLKYKGLTEQEIREFCADHLKDESKVQEIIKVSRNVKDFSYDILKSMIEEMNRYGEGVKDVLEILNVEVSPIFSSYKFVSITKNGKKWYPAYAQTGMINIASGTLSVNPWEDEDDLKEYLRGTYIDPKVDTRKRVQQHLSFDPSDITEVVDDTVRYDKDEWTVILKEKGKLDMKRLMIDGLGKGVAPVLDPIDQEDAQYAAEMDEDDDIDDDFSIGEEFPDMEN